MMKVKFYGVRGSYPVPGTSTMIYGGNTTCVTFTKENHGKISRIIIDSGTGIISLGREIIKNFFAGTESKVINITGQKWLEIKLFFTHLHPDHTQGFPFFAPNFFKNCEMTLFGMQALQKHIGDILAEQMMPPNFPIEYRNLKSYRHHKELKDGDFIELDEFLIYVMQANAPSHPQQGALYYKVVDKSTNRSAACIWDHESNIGGSKAVVNFAKNCNMMIHDTQYTDEEYCNDKVIVQDFGHSTYSMAIENARQANVKRLLCIHYNPAHTDADLQSLEQSLLKVPNRPEIILAREGDEFEV